LDTFVIMPDHIHGILRLRPQGQGQSEERGAGLSEIVRWFKSETMRAYSDGVRRLGWPRFEGRLWQRGFYDRILRDEDELFHARTYIHRNPARWHEREGDAV